MPLHEIVREPDRLEGLRAAVALQRGDSHLRHDLEQPFVHRLDVCGVRVGWIGLVRYCVTSHEIRDRLEGEHRVQRARAVADEQRDLGDIASLTCVQHDAHAGAQALAHEVVVHGGHGEQRGDRRPRRVYAIVAQDQQLRSRPYRRRGCIA